MLLTGDDLSIQLFIAGTAIAIMGIAVTQAGWTHKGFVWSLFVAAFGLAFCALYWKQIREANPEIGALASGIVASSVSWFTLLLVGIGAVFVLDLLARIGWLKNTVKREAPLPTAPPSKSDSPSPPVPNEEPKQRAYVTASVLSLMSMCEGRTSIQASQLAKNYIGKWILISGKVRNTSNSFGAIVASLKIGDGKHVFLNFDDDWEERVSLLMPDQDIKVMGKIAELGDLNVTLRQCEIIY